MIYKELLTTSMWGNTPGIGFRLGSYIIEQNCGFTYVLTVSLEIQIGKRICLYICSHFRTEMVTADVELNIHNVVHPL